MEAVNFPLRLRDDDLVEPGHGWIKILSTTRDKEFIPCVEELVQCDFYPLEGEVIYRNESGQFVVNIDIYGDVLTLDPLTFWRYVLLAVNRHSQYKRAGYEQCELLIQVIEQKIAHAEK